MIFFVLNVGRSGSKAVARAFNLRHEPEGSVVNLDNMNERMKNDLKTQGFYGETTHPLRWCIPELKTKFPNAIFLHLVRDGRKVVSSFLNRDQYLYTRKGDGSLDNDYGKNERLPIEGWDNLTRFQKICHYWNYWNDYFSQITESRIRLEDIQHAISRENETSVREPSYAYRYWTKEQRDYFWRTCGDLMVKYEYI